MTLEELWKIKDEQSIKYYNMTVEERRAYDSNITEAMFKRMGKDRFIPTDKPNVWKHVGKKTATV